MSLIEHIKGKGANGFGNGSTAEQVTEGLDLNSKTYLLTGCNSGIGKETMRVLALRGAKIIGLARSKESAMQAMADTQASGLAVSCDLSEPNSVNDAISIIQSHEGQLDGIIANAGIMALPKLVTKHGLELQFLTNHVGHFILVNGLLNKLKDDGRVAIVSSEAHRAAGSPGIQFDNLDGSKGYSAWRNYGQSKLANILFAKALSSRIGSKQTANALHPGVIKTNLGRYMNPIISGIMSIIDPLFFKSIPQGAATQCYVATHANCADQKGLYFADCNVCKPTKQAEDSQLAEKLWQVSREIVAKLTP